MKNANFLIFGRPPADGPVNGPLTRPEALPAHRPRLDRLVVRDEDDRERAGMRGALEAREARGSIPLASAAVVAGAGAYFSRRSLGVTIRFCSSTNTSFGAKSRSSAAS